MQVGLLYKQKEYFVNKKALILAFNIFFLLQNKLSEFTVHTHKYNK